MENGVFVGFWTRAECSSPHLETTSVVFYGKSSNFGCKERHSPCRYTWGREQLATEVSNHVESKVTEMSCFSELSRLIQALYKTRYNTACRIVEVGSGGLELLDGRERPEMLDGQVGSHGTVDRALPRVLMRKIGDVGWSHGIGDRAL